MPFVGKDLKTLELQRQRHLDELNQKSKNRIYFKKNKQHTKDTGSSLIAGPDKKTTLQDYLDKSKTDENIEKYIVKELGGNPGESKVFIQGLDDTLKDFLLERLPAFKKVFNDNFTVASATNLKSAFELFNRQQLEKIKDIDVPTMTDITDYLENLSDDVLLRFGIEIHKARFMKERLRSPDINLYTDTFNATPNKVRIVSADVRDYVSLFPNELDGYFSVYRIAESVGLRDFPRPKLEVNKPGIPTSTITPPIPTYFNPVGIPTLPTLPALPGKPEKIVGVKRYKDLQDLDKDDLISLMRNEFKAFYQAQKDDPAILGGLKKKQKFPMTPISIKDLKAMSKSQIIYELLARGYNPKTNKFEFKQYNNIQPPDKSSFGITVLKNDIPDLEGHMANYYDDWETDPKLKAGVDPDDLKSIEGFGYNRPGMVKIYKLKK